MLVKKVTFSFFRIAGFIILFLGLSRPPLPASEASAIFLEMPASPRRTAMGGAGAAVYGDGFSVFTNPASMTDIADRSFAFSYRDGIGGSQSSSLAYTGRLSRDHVRGIAIKYTGIESEERFAPDGLEPKFGSVFTNHGLAFGLYFANDNRSNSSVSGGGIKLIQEKLDDETANALAVDWGTKYEVEDISELFPYIQKKLPLYFALAIHDLGTDLEFIDKTEKLPTKITAGWAIMGYVFDRPLLVANDFIRNLPESHTEVAFGLEYYVTDNFSLRAGYNDILSEELDSTVSLGWGFATDEVAIDFSYRAGDELEDESHLALSFYL